MTFRDSRLHTILLLVSVVANVLLVTFNVSRNLINEFNMLPVEKIIVPTTRSNSLSPYTDKETDTGTDTDIDTHTNTEVPLHVSVPTNSENEVKPTLVYVLTKESGLGSQLIFMLCYKHLFQEYFNQDFIVDESIYGYRRNENIGLLTGFFTPTMPVIDVVHDRSRILSENIKDFNPETLHQYIDGNNVINESSPNNIYEMMSRSSKMNVASINGHERLTWDLFLSIFQSDSMDALYYELAKEACPILQFNAETKRDVQSLVEERFGIPYRVFDNDGTKTETETEDTNINYKKKSVGFHIRRGDKIKHRESKFYTVGTYIEKMIEVVGGLENAQELETCYLATDDSKVIKGIKYELKIRKMNCVLYTLTSTRSYGHDQKAFFKSNDQSAVLEFIADIAMLTRTTYFIGTMTSNVGRLVSLLRSCDHSSYFENDAYSSKVFDHDHYFQSYGVDVDHFVLFT